MPDVAIAGHLEELRDTGFTIVPHVLSTEEVEQLKDLLDHLYALFDPAIDPAGLDVSKGAAGERLTERPKERNWASNLVAKHSVMWGLIEREPVIDLIRQTIGEACVLSSMNSLEPIKGYGRQPLHRDEGPIGAEGAVTANSIWVLDGMDPDNGATRVVPGTHTTDELTGDDDPRVVYAEAPPGSVVVTNAHVLHAASENRDGRRRRVVHAYYTRRGRAVQTDWARYVPSAVVDRMPDATRRMLGL